MNPSSFSAASSASKRAVEPFKFYKGRAMRRWSRVLIAIAVLVVVSQLAVIVFATMHLEDFPNGSESTIELFGVFRHDMFSPGNAIANRDHDNNTPARTHLPMPPKDLQPMEEDHHLVAKDEKRHYSAPKEELPPQEEESRELIHIVHTRFMQHQGNLTTLGVARLKQFTSFCLPTMVNQTTQDFLWIIKVDPLLEGNDESRRKVLEPLLQAISAHEEKNIYVVASNYNFNVEGHKGSWRDGQEGEELLALNSSSVVSKVYSGDMDRLKRAYDLRNALPVLETRLDADDGLNLKYLERVQAIALDRFVGSQDPKAKPVPKPQWLYWCILTQIEWHSEIYSNNHTKSNASAQGNANQSSAFDSWELRNQGKKYYGNPSLGYLVPIANENFCITPGLTVGYGVETTVESVPRYAHTDLYPSLHSKFKFCYAKEDKASFHKGPCLERMGGVDKIPEGKTRYLIHAVRSRTLTSAGMDGVGNSDSSNLETNETTTAASAKETAQKEDTDRMESLLWRVLKSQFGIDPSAVKQTQKYLKDNRMEIAVENSLGQCTLGHSCKDKAQERLQKIVQSHHQTSVNEAR